MGVKRVHIVLSATERAQYRAQAEREGTSLSEWLRGAARDRLEQGGQAPLDTVAELDAFFERCDQASGPEREPDWEEHLLVIDGSRQQPAP